ncbi:apolipoprotein N-acyltransferase [Prochlorococcus marinus]|uniref:apolipoprotein N-acyltransferase n=1 Tax=Prochlorococcus marinus TaxID=1219 RepID=UPI000533A97D|nr:apolipoprotein N-acyltransferase [Prochlorococcus marinus]KGG14291.1 Apolipoprotein N-acyltransferase [Prochlorococcus marinus str. LG]
MLALSRSKYFAFLTGTVGGLLAGVGLSQGGVVFIWISTACLWASMAFPSAVFLWGLFAILLSYRWLLYLHPLTWIGVPIAFSLPIAILIWFSCGLLGGLLVALWSLIGQSPFFWFGLGDSLLPYDRWLAGLARWFGSGGLAALQLILGWWVWKIIFAFKKGSPWLGLFALGVCSLLLAHCIGWILLADNEFTSSKRIALWQTNIPTRQKFTLRELKRLPISLQDALEEADNLGADWMVAPEGTLSAGQNLLAPSPLPLLSGGFRRVKNKQMSSLLVFNEGSTSYSSAIDKHRLVPLGEWLPSLPGVNWNGLSFVGGVDPGDASRFFDWDGGPLAVAICYELSDGNNLAKAIFDGAEWILAIANLDPYPISLQRQFLALAQLRSIESARNLISVANTGPTSMILSSGKIKSIIEPFNEGVGVIDINVSQKISGYVRWGEIPLISSLLIVLCFIARLKGKA